jgi:hypothetical protein
LGESYDDGADGEDGEVKIEMVMVLWRLWPTELWNSMRKVEASQGKRMRI